MPATIRWGAAMLKYIAFYRKHRELFTGARDAGNVALLRSYPSIAYNHARAQLSAILTEQTLIQARIPFDLVFDEHLEDLSKYRVLILPDSECLSDPQLAAVRAFVEKGGGLLAIGQSGPVRRVEKAADAARPDGTGRQSAPRASV